MLRLFIEKDFKSEGRKRTKKKKKNRKHKNFDICGVQSLVETKDARPSGFVIVFECRNSC